MKLEEALRLNEGDRDRCHAVLASLSRSSMQAATWSRCTG